MKNIINKNLKHFNVFSILLIFIIFSISIFTGCSNNKIDKTNDNATNKAEAINYKEKGDNEIDIVSINKTNENNFYNENQNSKESNNREESNERKEDKEIAESEDKEECNENKNSMESKDSKEIEESKISKNSEESKEILDDPSVTFSDIPESEIDFTSPDNFLIEVNLTQQKVFIHYKDFIIKNFICSGGKQETPTPVGNFKTTQKIYYSYVPRFQQAAYYWTRFYGSYLFHSVPYDINGNLLKEELEKIGTPASHGCVRLYLEDAKWIYDKLPLGVNVNIHY